jgi:hypothetical protein
MLKNLIKQIPGARRLAQQLGLTVQQTDKSGRRLVLDLLPKHSIGAEIGVHLGDFSQQLINSVTPQELHLIDPWEYQTGAKYEQAWYGGQAASDQKDGQQAMDERYASVCDRFAQQIQSGQIKIHRGYSTDMLQQFPNEYFDWVYIDGNHLYEYVKADLELSFQKTKSGGFITGDDYTEGGWWEGGVKKAVDEFAQNETVQLIEIRDGQFIFRKK